MAHEHACLGARQFLQRQSSVFEGFVSELNRDAVLRIRGLDILLR